MTMTLMDPERPETFNLYVQKLANGNGKQYEICDQKPKNYVHGETPVMLLVHGFPELWYTWSRQIGPWVRHGWRVIAPNMLGYGNTSKPDDPALYTPLSIARDLSDLLDALEIKKPVIVLGHDWGAACAWAFAQRYTKRTRMMISVSIPFQPEFPGELTTPQLVKALDPNMLGYWLFLNAEDGGTIIDKNIERFVDMCFRSWKTTHKDYYKPGTRRKIMTGEIKIPGDSDTSDILTKAERDYYIKIFTEMGSLEAATRYYKSTPFRYKQEQELKFKSHLPKDMPILFIAPKHEPFTAKKMIDKVAEHVPSQETFRFAHSGHFPMLEEETSKHFAWIVSNWIDGHSQSDDELFAELEKAFDDFLRELGQLEQSVDKES